MKAEEASKSSAAAVQKRKEFEQSVVDREKKRLEVRRAIFTVTPSHEVPYVDCHSNTLPAALCD